MKKNKAMVLSLAAVSMACLWSLWPEQSTSVIDQLAITSKVLPAHSYLMKTVNSKMSSAVAPSPEVANQHSLLGEGVRLQMVEVAQAYQENSRYPKYSKPLYENDWNLLHPRAFIPKAIPLGFNEGLKAAIVLDQYIVSRDNNLAVRVVISGEALAEVKPETVVVSLSGLSKQAEGLSLTHSSFSEGVLTYAGVIDKSVFSSIDQIDVVVNAALSFDNGEAANVTAVFKLVVTDAKMTRLERSYVEGAHLIIPAYFDVLVPGYYRVEANLFDEESQAPISHLNSAFLLTARENSGLLKIHASTLRSKGFVGPYTLSDFNITRGPANPGDKTGYGEAEQDAYKVQGFDFSLYSQEAYEDPKNQQRLEFLQKMAGID